MEARPQGCVRANLCNLTITNALTNAAQTAILGLVGMNSVSMQSIFTYGSGGTSADVYVQTSLDKGVTWFDIANFHFLLVTASKMSVVNMYPSTAFTAGTVPGSAALAANTVLNGIIGDRLRALVTTVGTYAGGTTLTVDFVGKI